MLNVMQSNCDVLHTCACAVYQRVHTSTVTQSTQAGMHSIVNTSKCPHSTSKYTHLRLERQTACSATDNLAIVNTGHVQSR